MTVDLKLYHDALQAVQNADIVLRRVQAAFEASAAYMDGSVYLKKYRVKHVKSIVDKVMKRQMRGANGESGVIYDVKNVTDIVGVRLITENRMEIPAVVESILDTVDRHLKAGFQLFYKGPQTLSIAEAMIFHVEDKLDAADARVYEIFEKNGDLIQGKKYEIKQRKTGYSSVHIVLNCTVDGEKITPVEVQIRTIFEDIWAEMEHRIRYKGPFDAKSDSRLQRLSEEADKCFMSLRKQLMDCAKTSETIKQIKLAAVQPSQFSGVGAGALGMDSNLERRIEAELSDSSEFELSENIRAVILSLRDKFAIIYQDEMDVIINRPEQTAKFIADNVVAINDLLASGGELVREYGIVCAYLKHELGLCYYWLSRIQEKVNADNFELALKIRAKIISPTLGLSEVDANAVSLLSRAHAAYKSSEQCPYFKESVLTDYRIAEIVMARSDTSATVRFLEKVNKSLNERESDALLPNDHKLMDQIPLRLGMAYWQRGQEISARPERKIDPEFLLLDELRFYKKAMSVTLEVFKRAAERNDVDAKQVAGHNLLDYYVVFVRAGRNSTELNEIGLTPDLLQEALEYTKGQDNPTFLDTLRGYYEVTESAEAARPVAMKLLEVLKDEQWAYRYSKGWVAEMKRDAEATLRQ